MLEKKELGDAWDPKTSQKNHAKLYQEKTKEWFRKNSTGSLPLENRLSGVGSKQGGGCFFEPGGDKRSNKDEKKKSEQGSKKKNKTSAVPNHPKGNVKT